MKICGIELKSNNAIVSVINYENDKISYVDTQKKKIILENDEDIHSVLKFKNEIEDFLSENKIDKISLKKRAKKGTFAGGAVTFKSEAIIQLNDKCEVVFVTGQAIAKYIKANDIVLPNKLNKYQEHAYYSSLLLI
jgi:hypothetical protein